MKSVYAAALAAFCILLSIPAAGQAETASPAPSSYENSALAAGKADGPTDSPTVREESKEKLVLLTWQDDPESVRYEVEIFRGLPSDLDRNQPLEDHLYDNQRIYSNKVLVDLSQFPDGTEPLYWRVRPIDANWEGMGPFSSPMEVRSTMKPVSRYAPYPNVYRPGNGSTLLYPVYSYAGNPGAAKYEVEVTSAYPENTEGTAPSKYRVFSKITSLSNVYDDNPRIGTFYWRVRGLDENGNAVGIWSMPEKVRTNPEEHFDVGIYGDSITQGGGHLYHSPADMAYSYVTYLDFPAVNMGRSGDTTEMMEDRFDHDVLPFHVKYLLIMGGINDLRMGADPNKVIGHLEAIRKKCIEHHITPILLTIVPINPENIQKYYGDVTYSGWQESVKIVNDYIKSQPHIDTAAPFADYPVMPSELAMDGIHGDWNAKQMIAGEINRHIGEFIKK
ncbi:GDSL-type esterase/lipase family protein [uncultured Dialister sp.]|jgi:lysophospholipase L1-like esterase|uniref:SGNH/GDSL hydrolase family protein n=1 Tax=uncultured Dialister sp. TaxID=278064 RepID=UPI0025D46546|nr:GDSL-type esterase/lipase family protein [uncultured Dialister sp.]